MTIFRLKIQRFAQNCLFELSWGTGQQLSATLHYPESVSSLYQEWQRTYLSFYKSALRGRVEASGSIAPPPIDWHARLIQAEARLLSEFHHWLRGAELFEIRAEIANSRLPRVNNSISISSQYSNVNVFLSCYPIEIERLPWESWEIGADFPTLGEIRIVRIPLTIRSETETKPQHKRGKKARILAILGDDTGLNFQEDREAVHSLSRSAEIKFVGWQPGLDIAELKANICQALADEKGWDILFFAGHSNETLITGGELAIAPDVSISISEIKPQLILAKERGLKFALFNSCCGLSIASSLIDLGLNQVAVMREPIHNQVAQVFLSRFLQEIAEYKNVQDALVAACQYLRLEKSLTYPSACLVPSLFCHPGAVFFQIKPYGFKEFIKRLSPTPLEAIALTALVFLSLSLTVQDNLLEKRILIQSIYRHTTGQLPKAEVPKVLLVAIDDRSIREAKISNPKPMNREYLAKLINKLSSINARVIGIDYLLDRPHIEQDLLLSQAIKSAVEKPQYPTWFVFASVRDDTEGWLKILPEIASPNWSFQGHINMVHWYMRLVPDDDPISAKMPLAYMLALAYWLNIEFDANLSLKLDQKSGNLDDPKDSQLPVPKLASKTNLFAEVITYLNREKGLNYQTLFSPSSQMQPITSLSYDWGQMWLQPIIDFSIPPEQIYQHLPAWELLKSEVNSPQLQHLPQQIVLIVPGGYSEAGVIRDGEDNFPIPPAVKYWLNQRHHNQRRYFTGGEAHAYMIHHLLHQRLVVPIPDLWIIGLVIILGKTANICLLHRQKLAGLLLVGGLSIYGLISLQAYLSLAVLLPWVLPGITLGIYTLPIVLKLKQKKIAKAFYISGYNLFKDSR